MKKKMMSFLFFFFFRFAFVNINQRVSHVTHWKDVSIIRYADIPAKMKTAWRNLNAFGALRLFRLLAMALHVYKNVVIRLHPVVWIRRKMDNLPKAEQLGVYGKTFMAHIITGLPQY